MLHPPYGVGSLFGGEGEGEALGRKLVVRLPTRDTLPDIPDSLLADLNARQLELVEHSRHVVLKT